jgi:glyoxalase family protein
MSDVLGIHHVTAIAGDPQANYEFYVNVLGMRLVKRSVNQDDPGTYHLFYADGEGHPGSDLTFFPWRHLPPGRPGTGQITRTSLAVPTGTLGFWTARLAEAGVAGVRRESLFGEAMLAFRDPHGLAVALVEMGDARAFTPWEGSPVPADRQIAGIHAVAIPVRSPAPTSDVLASVLGFTRLAGENGWHRYGPPGGGSGTYVDLREAPEDPPGRQGAGSVHHVAFRVADDRAEAVVRARVQAAGLRPTPVIDRFWFKSVYFLEPGGVLFELATDGPGFAVDEDAARLGETLVLPPWLEPHRAEIESALPQLTTGATGGGSAGMGSGARGRG